MGQHERMAALHELLSHGTQGEKPVENDVTGVANQPDPDDELAAVRGIVIGVVLGVATWGVILWVVMWQISG